MPGPGAELAKEPPARLRHRREGTLRDRALALVARPGFQSWAARVPGLRRIVRAEGRAMFELVSGFVQTQILLAVVELRVLHLLCDGPLSVADLARRCGLEERPMQLLLQAASAQRLLRLRRDGRFALARRGAALLGVPGLEAMIRHHHVLYADLADPVALLRGETEPKLARFWPYVFGAESARDPAVTDTYSDLMSDSQALVAAETLRLVDLRGVRHLMDVGGGSGAFLAEAGAAHPALQMTLFDLPAVTAAAIRAMARAGLSDRVCIRGGSFRDDPLPHGADALSLVRVLYDHADDTVALLLRAAYAALPPGGLLIVSEPMSGGARPDPITDTYFALYTFAMGTGRTRSAAEIARAVRAAGFVRVDARAGFRPFVTSVVTARKPGGARI